MVAVARACSHRVTGVGKAHWQFVGQHRVCIVHHVPGVLAVSSEFWVLYHQSSDRGQKITVLVSFPPGRMDVLILRQCPARSLPRHAPLLLPTRLSPKASVFVPTRPLTPVLRTLASRLSPEVPVFAPTAPSSAHSVVE